jgi:hypothetical protein
MLFYRARIDGLAILDRLKGADCELLRSPRWSSRRACAKGSSASTLRAAAISSSVRSIVGIAPISNVLWPLTI